MIRWFSDIPAVLIVAGVAAWVGAEIVVQGAAGLSDGTKVEVQK